MYIDSLINKIDKCDFENAQAHNQIINEYCNLIFFMGRSEAVIMQIDTDLRILLIDLILEYIKLIQYVKIGYSLTEIFV